MNSSKVSQSYIHNIRVCPANTPFHLPLSNRRSTRAWPTTFHPRALVQRHPFPGPGPAIRILGPVTRAQVQILQQADAIYLEEIRAAGLYQRISQAFAVLLPVRAVGVMGDQRTYEQVIALRAVQSEDFMTADWFVFPPDVLRRISSRITNEIAGINRVTYDITSKPPGVRPIISLS